MNRARLTTLAVSGLLPLLPAQKLPMNDGSDRQIVVLDVGALLPRHRGVVEPPPTPDGRSAATVSLDLQRLAAFVRAFATGLDGPVADLQPLGDRHLVVLGSPVQVAAAERLVAHSGKVQDQQYQIDVRMCEVPPAAFDRDVAPLLQQPAGERHAVPPAPRTTVLDTAAAITLLKALKKHEKVKITQFPQIVAEGLKLAKLRVGKQLAYVRDFEVETAGTAFVANPVVEELFDGYDVDVLCAETRDGMVGVQLQLVDQVVEKPIPELTTTVPGSTMEVKVQVPRITGCRASLTVEMADGATALVAARKNDGSWLLSLMTPYRIRSAPAVLPRPR